MKRYCQNPSCGKPLGSTDQLCHECGGRSFRGERSSSSITPFLPGVRQAFEKLFGGGR